MLNLLSNAFKFTETGEIEVKLEAKESIALLSIRDTGTGISEEQFPHIFERFHRVDGVRARTQEGTGIGLALVQELVKLQGGEVAVTSIPGKGSTFTVSVPLGTAHIPKERIQRNRLLASTSLGTSPYVIEAMRWLPEEKPALAENALLSGETSGPAVFHRPGTEAGLRSRIVLADDNADMRAYVSRLLSPHYEVITVSDGNAALQAVHMHHPDLVLSDVMMPGLNGFQLVQELRADARTRILPIILLSARAGEEAHLEGLSARADDYLTKPFSARELLARVASHLEMARVRREAASAIQASEERFRATFAYASMGISLADMAGHFVQVNPAFCAITGYAQEALYETDFESITHPDDLDRNLVLMQQALRGERVSYIIRNRYIRPDGAHVWVENSVSILRDNQENPVNFISLTEDITERMQAESEKERLLQALRGSEARLRAIIDNTSSVIYMKDLAGRYVLVNHAFEKLNGKGQDEVRGKTDSELFPPQLAAPVVANDRRVLETGETLEAEEGGPHEDRTLTYLSTKFPLRDEDGNIYALCGISTDITERKQREEAIVALNARLRRSMTETHHRVKNNLQVISAMIEMQVQEYQHENVIPLEQVNQLKAHVHTLAIVHDLLTKSVKEDEDAQRVSAKAVLDRLLPMLQRTAWNKAVRFSIKEAALTSKQCIALALVLNELVTNALKHGKKAADVVFRIEGTRGTLVVSDDGPGFPTGFDPAQAANMGLDLVESLVHTDLQGKSHYENRTEGGGRVVILFPLPT